MSKVAYVPDITESLTPAQLKKMAEREAAEAAAPNPSKEGRKKASSANLVKARAARKAKAAETAVKKLEAKIAEKRALMKPAPEEIFDDEIPDDAPEGDPEEEFQDAPEDPEEEELQLVPVKKAAPKRESKRTSPPKERKVPKPTLAEKQALTAESMRATIEEVLASQRVKAPAKRAPKKAAKPTPPPPAAPKRPEFKFINV